MKKAYVVGTADTKGPELQFVRDLLGDAGVSTVLVNVGTKGGEQYADTPAAEVAACHPDGPAAVFVNDRGRAVIEMVTGADGICHGTRRSGRHHRAGWLRWLGHNCPRDAGPSHRCAKGVGLDARVG